MPAELPLSIWPSAQQPARAQRAGRYVELSGTHPARMLPLLLRPGGMVVMTVRPWWRDGRLVDLPGALSRVGEQAGLILYERNVALLCALRDDRLVPRSSFFALEQVRKARARGVPRFVTAHEDLLAWRLASGR